MTETWVALLYSVVLAPGRRVESAALRALATDLGFAAPRTLAATGNLVFAAEGAAQKIEARAIEARLEAAVADRLGRAIPVFVRDAAAWRRLVADNPFRAAAEAAPASVHVRVMREPVMPEALAALEAKRAEGEGLAVVDGDLWIRLPQGFASSRLATAAGAARVGAGTFRNWNTVRRLGEMLPPESGA